MFHKMRKFIFTKKFIIKMFQKVIKGVKMRNQRVNSWRYQHCRAKKLDPNLIIIRRRRKRRMERMKRIITSM